MQSYGGSSFAPCHTYQPPDCGLGMYGGSNLCANPMSSHSGYGLCAMPMQPRYGSGPCAMPMQPGYGSGPCAMPMQSGYGSGPCAMPMQPGYGSGPCAMPMQPGYGSGPCAMPMQPGYGSGPCAMPMQPGYGSGPCAMPMQPGYGSGPCAMPMQPGYGSGPCAMPMQPGYGSGPCAMPMQPGFGSGPCAMPMQAGYGTGMYPSMGGFPGMGMPSRGHACPSGMYAYCFLCDGDMFGNDFYDDDYMYAPGSMWGASGSCGWASNQCMGGSMYPPCGHSFGPNSHFGMPNMQPMNSFQGSSANQAYQSGLQRQQSIGQMIPFANNAQFPSQIGPFQSGYEFGPITQVNAPGANSYAPMPTVQAQNPQPQLYQSSVPIPLSPQITQPIPISGQPQYTAGNVTYPAYTSSAPNLVQYPQTLSYPTSAPVSLSTAYQPTLQQGQNSLTFHVPSAIAPAAVRSVDTQKTQMFYCVPRVNRVNKSSFSRRLQPLRKIYHRFEGGKGQSVSERPQIIRKVKLQRQNFGPSTSSLNLSEK